MSQSYTLYTFAMSHYSEKIRWVLDHCELPYQEVCLTPMFHIRPALRMGGQGKTHLPILKANDRCVQDSRAILQFLQQQHGQHALLNGLNQQAVQQTCDRFDGIGRDVARYLYANSFGRSDAAIKDLWTAHASRWQSMAIRAGYPLIRKGFQQKLGIHRTAGVARAAQRIHDTLGWLDQQLAQRPAGQLALHGPQLSVADITAAALLAPLACPPEHPVYGTPEFSDAMAGATANWQDRPGIQWVRSLYQQQRGRILGGLV